VHEFHVWRLAGQKIIATVHVRFRSLHDYMGAADKIKSFFHDRHIHSTTIQPEFAEMVDDLNTSALADHRCFINCPSDPAAMPCDASTTQCCDTRVPPPTPLQQMPAQTTARLQQRGSRGEQVALKMAEINNDQLQNTGSDAAT